MIEKNILNLYDTEEFKKNLKEYGLILEEKQIRQFLKYYELLVEWNSFMNLTGITEFNEVIKKHFIDSLSIVKYYDFFKIHSLIDVGTGAGFPGIPLKIAFPDLKVTLLDSLQKRIRFLNKVIEELELERIDAIHGRAEDLARDLLREKYDFCVSRAVANLSTLSEYCIPFVKVKGSFAAYKSEKAADELENAKKAVSVLGGVVENQYDFVLPDSDIKRTILFIKKEKETPKKFPRKAGLPLKEPIQ